MEIWADSSNVLCYSPGGEVAERLMAPLSKSGSRLHRDVGSNPTLSAILDTEVAPTCGLCKSGMTVLPTSCGFDSIEKFETVRPPAISPENQG